MAAMLQLFNETGSAAPTVMEMRDIANECGLGIACR
jgi:hypothetical protein